MRNLIICFIFIIFSLDSIAQVGYRNRLGVGSGNTQTDQNKIDYSNPKEYEIADIEVKGLETLNKSALISLSGLKVGDRIKLPGEKISSAIKKLWKHGIIGNVSINVDKVEDGKVWLVIELTERPRLTRINITGVSKSQQKELKEDVSLVRGRVLTDAIKKNTELAVKKYFVNKGFLNTKVVLTQEKDTLVANGVKVNVKVDKGHKVHINEIYFSGVEDLDESTLKRKMKKTKEKVRVRIFEDMARGLLSINSKELKTFFSESYEADWKQIKKYINDNVKLNFFNASKFVGKEYENDKDALIAFYNHKGYRDAAIVKDTVYLDKNENVIIDIEIYEGRKYFFRDIKWVGNFVYSDEQLDRVLGVEKGDVYDLELINKKLQFNPTDQDISGLYMDNGYLASRIEPVEVRVEGDSIDVEMRIYEGKQFTINNVVVRGNDRTNDHVIYRELRTRPGDLFSRNQIIRTQRELSQLGYFDPEQITPNVNPNMNDNTVEIEWDVVERPSDQIELSGGWGGSFGFIGTLGLTFNNFSLRNILNKEAWHPLPTGDGQKLSVRAQANGVQYQSYSMSFQEPWLGGKKPQSFSVSGTYSIQRGYNPTTARYDAGSLIMKGFSVGLGKRIKWPDDYFTLSHSISYYQYVLNEFVADYRLGFNNGISNNFSYNIALSRNSIDQPMYPRAGSQFTIGLTLTPPYSLFNDKDYASLDPEDRYNKVEFYKVLFDLKQYQKVVGNLVLEAKAHFGFIGNYKATTPIGPFERFVMGGSGLAGQSYIIGYDVISLRGYEDASILPRESDPKDPSNYIEGGTSFVKFGAELRYPLSLSPTATIYVLGFLEGGNNWANIKEFNTFDLYKSAGFGARIFMPAFGLIGIDWGYGFDTLPGRTSPSGSQFHFTIGQQFK
ncbi:BamA/OMP85 family outer membrane protein [Aureibacter tunicatorum]|uniref:Outer membrane protein insertion porin family n=1 Tax=Aureibacter tunicatorum TaxID=866807 RepID=A0AAE3XKG3_9BACT|nr:POTRA domain-containing protein [Aureibacter tunicatorum]MDR6238072.1 outer membrane protein insertion porin family [Aureibacter tunicatorum]BDD03105.1 outer membrane protein assembly factor BamA [Aureibacter tunicatorum]